MRVIRRSEWCTTPRNGVPTAMPLPGPRVWLHHGASGTSTVATANAYVRYHIEKHGWMDGGYSFIVAAGQILEVRGAGRQGAHTSGDNDQSHGLCIAGDYSTNVPAQRDLDALRWLLRHGVEQGWWSTAKLTGGHRDAPGASTSCPGETLYRLIPQINTVIDPIPAEPENDDMALTAAQEKALALIPQLAADIDEIRRTLGTRPHAQAMDDLGRLRRTLRSVAQKVGAEYIDA